MHTNDMIDIVLSCHIMSTLVYCTYQMFRGCLIIEIMQLYRICNHIVIRNNFKIEMKISLTGNSNLERPPFLSDVYLTSGTATCSMHERNCHWLRPKESPMNKSFFPFNFVKKSMPLNLQ